MSNSLRRRIQRHAFGAPHASASILLIFMMVFVLVACATNTNVAHNSAIRTPTEVQTARTGIASSTSAEGTATEGAAGVWATLERKPLHLSAVAPGTACPSTPVQQHVSPDFGAAIGAGPVYIVAHTSTTITYTDAAALGDAGSSWGGAKVYWQIRPTYQGPVLIRGQQLDGPHVLRFNGGLGQTQGNSQGTAPLLDMLQFQAQSDAGPSWFTWITFTRLEAPGCYAYQIDGLTFSEIIVFQATAQ